jgi:hypothetical protein
MKATTPKEVLIATKYILDNVGWCQGNAWQNKEGERIRDKQDVLSGKSTLGACCLIGAISLVECDDLSRGEALRSIIEDVNTVAVSWNDSPGRTKRQVITMLNQVIKKVS